MGPGPSIPATPPPSPPPTQPMNSAVAAARRRLEELRKRRSGLKSTQLTGPAGVRPLPSLRSPVLSPAVSTGMAGQ